VKRALVMLALLGCASQPVSSSTEPPDAGPQIGLTVIDKPIVIVRGSTTTVRVSVANPFHVGSTLAIAPSQLAEGVTATSATWNDGPEIVSLDFTAASDASEGEIPIEIRASADGKILASTDTLLAVSDSIGALDTTFGDHGLLYLPNASAHPVALRVLADGTIVVAGWDYGQMFVHRLAPDGSVTATFTQAIPAPEIVAAIGDDGRTAFATNGFSGGDVFTMDATGNVTDLGHFVQTNALSWDGDAVFIASGSSLTHASTSGRVDTIASLLIESLETIGSGVVVAGGSKQDNATVTTYTFDGTTFIKAPDITIGKQMSVTNSVTDAFGSFAGLQGSSIGAVRVQNDAIVDTFTTSSTSWGGPHMLVLPNETPVVFGIFATGLTAGTAIVQAFSLPFGAAGRTYVRFGIDTTCTSGALDPTSSFMYIAGSAKSDNGLRGFVSRIRLTSTP
jgi:hypothetical protein